MKFRSSSPTLWLAIGLTLLALAHSAAAQDKFRDRHYRVRIAIADEVDGLVLRSAGAYQVVSSAGAALTRVTDGQITFVQITRGKPGSRIYRLVLREMDQHQVDAAIDVAKTAKDQYRLPVKVLRIPGKSPADTRIIVTAGEYHTLQEARDQIRKLPKVQINYIYEDRARAQQGEVRLVSRDGAILARDGRYLRLVPLDWVNGDLAVQELEDGQWSPSRMRRARRYRGEIELTINEEGTLTAINDLWIEYYLYSVVPAEIGDEAPDEAFKAQAVAGRSEAVAKIEKGIVSSKFFDFYDTSIAQTYKGKGEETERARRAVDATRGEILVWSPPGKPPEAIDAVYGASCGGYVASSNDVWDGNYAGYSRSMLDTLGSTTPPKLDSHAATEAWLDDPMPEACCSPTQPGFPRYARGDFRWETTMNGAAYSKLANALFGVGRVKDVRVERRKDSGRVRAIRIIGDRKAVNVTRELAIREALNNAKSNLFVVNTSHDGDGYLSAITVKGAGFGHGVGMCQMGAYMLAKKGYNYRQILGHYYANVRIRRLYR